MKTTILASVLSILASGVAHAADVAVLPVQGTNLEAGEVEAIGVLIANAYGAEAKVDVLGPVQVAKVEQTVDPAGGVPAIITALGVKEYVEVAAVRLKTKLTLHAVLRSADGNILHSVDVTAASLDDMEQVSQRIAKALVNRLALAETQTIHNVTKNEGKATNRTFVEKVMGLKTAFILPVASGLKFQPAMSLSFDGRFETDKGFLEFGVGFTLPTLNDDDKIGLGGLFTEFGGSYYLMDQNVSPYIGAGVIPRIYWGSSDGGVRAAIYGQAGVMFMRESSTRLYAELRVAQNILPFSRERSFYSYDSGSSSSSSHDYYPTEFSLNVGIGW